MNLINKLNDDLTSFKNKEINQNKLLKTILECLYAVRCNLFHGEKSITRRQRGLMNHSTSLLKSLLDIALKDYKKRYLKFIGNAQKSAPDT